MAKDTKISSNNGDCENKMVKKLSYKKLNKVTGFLILNAKKAFI